MYLFILLVLLPSICCGETIDGKDQKNSQVSDDIVEYFVDNTIDGEIVAMGKELQTVSEKLKTCSPTKSQYYQIFGMENDLCHFKFADYDCLVPVNIAEEYADLGLKSAQLMIKGEVNTQSPENLRIQEILSDKDYCSYKMTWTVTMEDEDGNEVPVEGLIIE